MNAFKVAAATAGLCLGSAWAGSPTAVQPYQTIPGVSPEPIVEGAGLKSKEDLEAFLDGVMNAHLKAQNSAGAVVAVVKDGELFFAKGYGYADREKRIPVDPEKTLFRTGSVSKLATWTALMQMVEQGKVDLDADVNTYLDFKLDEGFEGKPITARNLLTHTTGLEDGAVGYLIVDALERMETDEEVLKNHPLKRVRAPATDFNQVEMASYSNYATSLAGYIVERLSGQPIHDYLDQHVFAPLGMLQTSFRQPLPELLAPHMSVGYRYQDGQVKPMGFEYVSASTAGSQSASATDMAKFMIAHLNRGEYKGKRILKEETARLMHARATSPSPYLNGNALGFYENYTNGRRIITHAGDVVAFHSELNLLLDENVGIFYSVNSGATLPFSARSELLRLFMDRYYPAKLPQLKGPEDFKARVAQYAGAYRANRHSYTKLEKAAALGPNLNVVPTENNSLLISGGAAPVLGEWFEVKPGVFRRGDSDQMIGFATGADGNTYILNPLGLAPINAYKLKAWETMGSQLLILGLGALAFVVALIGMLRHWKADRAAPAGARTARRVAGVLGLTQIIFLVLFGIVGVTVAKDFLAGWPDLLYVALAFPLLAVPLTLATLWYAVSAWRGSWWTRYGRIQYSLIALAGTGFLLSLHYWNLLGYHIG